MHRSSVTFRSREPNTTVLSRDLLSPRAISILSESGQITNVHPPVARLFCNLAENDSFSMSLSRSQLPLLDQLPLLWVRPFRYLPKSISGTQPRAMAPTSTVSPITFQPWAPKGKMPRPYNEVANAINRKKGPVR